MLQHAKPSVVIPSCPAFYSLSAQIPGSGPGGGKLNFCMTGDSNSKRVCVHARERKEGNRTDLECADFPYGQTMLDYEVKRGGSQNHHYHQHHHHHFMSFYASNIMLCLITRCVGGYIILPYMMQFLRPNHHTISFFSRVSTPLSTTLHCTVLH